MAAGPFTIAVLFAVVAVGGVFLLLRSRPSVEARHANVSAGLQFDKDDINRAALKLVHPRVLHVFPSYLGGTLDSADRAATRLAALRHEFASFEPEYMRREIMGWLNYYDRELADKRADIVSGKSKMDLDAYRKKVAGDDDRARSVLQSISLER